MGSITQQIADMQNRLSMVVEDAAKAERGNKAAATRLRKAMMGIRTSANAVRVAALEATRTP